MSGIHIEAVVDHMKAAARIGGESLVQHFNRLESVQIMEKGPSDFVSAADLEAEALIFAHLAKEVGNIPVLGEESGGPSPVSTGACIIVDPLDGTNNFVHGVPHFSTSLALIVNGELQAGVTYNPINGEMFWAFKNGGAYLGDRKLHGSPRKTLPRAILGTCFPYHGKGDVTLCAREMAAIMPHVSGIRSPGSAALEIAYVAEGRFDGFWNSGAKLDLWDVAAGVIIAREAGCIASEIDGIGNPLDCRSLLVAPTQYHGRLVEILATASK